MHYLLSLMFILSIFHSYLFYSLFYIWVKHTIFRFPMVPFIRDNVKRLNHMVEVRCNILMAVSFKVLSKKEILYMVLLTMKTEASTSEILKTTNGMVMECIQFKVINTQVPSNKIYL
jgi:hypothetical protein